jgi:hypothetical protein
MAAKPEKHQNPGFKTSKSRVVPHNAAYFLWKELKEQRGEDGEWRIEDGRRENIERAL